MRQVQATSRVGPDGIRVVEVTDASVPGTGQVKVKVHAAGVNYYDLYTSYGINATDDAPRLLGLEAAGVVVAVGSKTSLKPGDRVVVHCPAGGAFCDFVTVSDDQVMLLPNSISFADAACLTVSYLTAHFALHLAGGLRPNGSVFIHSVAGSVGWAATQLALQVAGVRVVGTTSSSKMAAVQANGVHLAISNDQDYVAAVKAALPEGVSLVLDCHAGPHLARGLDMLQPLGKVVVIGAKEMITKTGVCDINTPDVSPLTLMLRNVGVAGLHLTQLQREAPTAFRAAWREILDFAATGIIRPAIYRRFPIEEVDEACRQILDRHNIGKIIIEFNE
ncbi:synaptic vesicle membrane protein VAT-1 homolog [Hyalella azteca]|uniref:Synaptic vesicle membrane protein VAT-1 homolog n=1 Tax=Hyalella azteca TaxID=294128 RepID=A0A8B7NG76_HYAAZ|nr:synaptic vesicle membrane protein VAT-1 homolog [Hyalella azteca]